MILLKQEVIKAIRKRDNAALRLRIQTVLNVSNPTLYKYLRTNSHLLTNANVLQVLENSKLFQDGVVCES